MFFAQISFELVILTVDLLILAVSGELHYTHPKHIPVFSILRLSVPQFWTTPSDQLPSHGTVAAHAPCHVNYKLEGGEEAKWPTFFKSLTKIYIFTL